MSQPRGRLTVRRLMLLILLVAASLTAFEAGRRWERTRPPRPEPFDAVEMESL